MTRTRNRFSIALMWIFSIIAAFVVGFCFRIAYYVFPSAVHSFSVIVHGPMSQDGILFSTKAIIEANKVAESLISSSTMRKRNFNPKVIVAPAYGGYTVSYSSGSPVVDFPEDLLDSVKDAVGEVLESDLRSSHGNKENRDFKIEVHHVRD